MLTSRQSLLPRPGGGKDLGQRVARTYHEDKSCVVQHKQKLDGGEWGLGISKYIYIYGDNIGIALPYSLQKKVQKAGLKMTLLVPESLWLKHWPPY